MKVSYTVVERSLYEQRCREGDVEIGTWDLQRCSIVMADPGAFTPQYFEGPWATLYGTWYRKNRMPRRPSRRLTMPSARSGTPGTSRRSKPDETKRNALFKQMLDIHKDAPWMIGTCGENPMSDDH